MSGCSPSYRVERGEDGWLVLDQYGNEIERLTTRAEAREAVRQYRKEQ